MQKVVPIFMLLVFWTISFGQMPARQINTVALKKEIYGGAFLHTNGWGANIVYTKFKTNKIKSMFIIDVLNMKHSKELKIEIDKNAKDFVYGKLNGLYVFRAGYGKKYTSYEKIREKGVNIFWHWNIGPSFGFLKPIYLDVENVSPSGKILPPLQEPYNPEKHNLGNIYGGSKGLRGLAETRVSLGLFAKFGFEFEYNADREFIKALAVGIAIDIYPKKMEIMAYSENTFIFPSFYINLLIGKRYL